MSQENVETTRRFTEAVVRKDYAAAATELSPMLEIDDTDIPESTGADSLFRDGKIVRIGYYNDQSQAVAAAGLSE